MLSTAVTIYKTIGLAPVEFNRTTNKYCASFIGYMITLTHMGVLIYCNCSHWWLRDHVVEGPVASLHQNTISKIYLQNYWYLGMTTRAAFFPIVLAVSRPYLKLLNSLVAAEATWKMIGFKVHRRSRV
jgi:hypothetical protein